MKRYVAVRADQTSSWMDPIPLLPNITVYERDNRSTPTGIYTHDGLMIHRVEEKIKMGFC